MREAAIAGSLTFHCLAIVGPKVPGAVFANQIGCGSSPEFESGNSTLYNSVQNLLADASPNSPPPKPRRWTIVAAGFLLLALALVVIYTSRAAFFSPLALVVIAAIGLAALILQLRLRQGASGSVRAPLWLNALGLIFALAAVFFHLSANQMQIAALGAVLCFAASGIVVLRAMRKK